MIFGRVHEGLSVGMREHNDVFPILSFVVPNTEMFKGIGRT
jgi:hypothetical protein